MNGNHNNEDDGGEGGLSEVWYNPLLSGQHEEGRGGGGHARE